ncbi:SHD1 domain-containing protein [Luteolibacter sp. AS25]|uniref:SHD1 domain-containing protein n=1 Tax=Luteolibacter sp. AS25 TaxID=3135776 RepID=UPI00398AA410
MLWRKPLIAALLICGTLTTATAGEERTFSSSEGKEIRASFLSFQNNNVTLRRADGKSFDVPLDRLSKADQDYIASLSSAAEDEAAAINDAAGLEISSGKSFHETDAGELAAALGLKPESTSKHGKSWRLYASFVKDYTLFGAMPYSVALYSREDGTLRNISIVYANKGDFGSTAGFAEDHFQSIGTKAPGTLAEAMDLDEKTLTTSLNSVFGDGTSQRYGESGTRRDITRWDWNGHSFLLSSEEGEYVSLAIVSTETADNEGKSERMDDSTLKSRLAENVVIEENGDVHISEIPMVDQGPKGYCVPATFERAMRTMGIDADMYLLAMVGQSSAGGGTIVELLLDNVKSAVYRKGRRTKDDSIKGIKIRDVKRYIDEGIPVMWSMCSMDEYNEIANNNTKLRSPGATALSPEIAAATEKILDQPAPDDHYHICMIIGYNETTGELAVSDSWGKRYELRWVPVEVASWASNGSLFMILP